MACQNIVIVSDSADNRCGSPTALMVLFRAGSSKSLYKSIISAIDKKNIWDQFPLMLEKQY